MSSGLYCVTRTEHPWLPSPPRSKGKGKGKRFANGKYGKLAGARGKGGKHGVSAIKYDLVRITPQSC